VSRIAFHRPARIPVPLLPEDKLHVPAPPNRPEKQPAGMMLMTLLLPLLSSVSMAAYMITFGKPVLIVVGISFVLISAGSVIGMRFVLSGARRKEAVRQRMRYRAHLEQARDNARALARAQREVALWVHPSPQRLWAVTTTLRRVWERRSDDQDFLLIRLGVGRLPLAAELQVGDGRIDPMGDYDREALADAQHIVDRFGMVSGQPVVADVNGAGVVSLLGPPDAARALARALLCQVSVLHAPDDVLIAARTGGRPEWDWLKWLPHTFEPDAAGQAGVVSLVAAEFDGIADFIVAELERRQQLFLARRPALGGRDQPPRKLLVLLDSYHPAAPWARSAVVRELLTTADPDLGVTVVCLGEQDNQQPGRVDLRMRVDEGGRLLIDGDPRLLPGGAEEITADLPSATLAELTARMLTPLTLTEERERLLSRTVSLSSMLGTDLEADDDITARWVSAEDEAMLRVPVGIDGDGRPVVLDLKESAQGGMGPHGLIVGATGSGKSELLRTLVTGLALTHPPDLLSFVLVDFKGGATFAQHTELPHVAGLITNLSDDLALVDRVMAALRGEQQRREHLLKDAGNIDSVRTYQLRRAAGHTDARGRPLPPLPYLLVIADEFGELLSARPDFIDLFVQIGRVGRSLGIHLLLATQRLEEGRLRGLESHLSFRICLRTFTAMESRAVIGTTDAYQLPSIPGSAYLKVDESVYQRFRVAHISGPYVTAAERAAQANHRAPQIAPYGLRQPPAPEDAAEGPGSGAPGRRGAGAPRQPGGALPAVVSGLTEMQVTIERLKLAGQPVHQVWLPPLPRAFPLDTLTGAPAAQTSRGLQAAVWPYQGNLRFPAGILDLPAMQQQPPLVLDFTGPHGHLAIAGAPQTGRSTLLRTLILSAILTNSPEEAQFYCIDFGGGTLAPYARAPHVGGVASRSDIPRVRRVLADVHALVTAREQLFHQLGADSMVTFRRMREAGRLPAGTRAADVFLVIDNWGALRGQVDVADAQVLDIAARGLGAGIHLVLTANRWADVRANLRDAFSTRLELRLGDPTESEVGRPQARALAVGLPVPGRGLAVPGVYFQAALPRTDGRDDAGQLREAEEDVLDKVAAAWNGGCAPPVRVLPERVTLRELPAPAGGGVPLGIGEADLAPVSLDLTEGDPHLLVFGDVGSGKSTLLRVLARGLTAAYRPERAKLVVVDYRRALLDAAPDEHLAGYAADPASARGCAELIARTLSQRTPPSDISPRALRARDWWQGPEIYLLVDDYDLLGSGHTAPLAPLADYLPHARETGLHLIVARRTAGAGRVMLSDPVLTRVRDLGTQGLLLSGDPREGALVADQRAARLPPGRGMLLRRGQQPALIQIAAEGEHDEHYHDHRHHDAQPDPHEQTGSTPP
jgi:ESX secretion system protein EccC